MKTLNLKSLLIGAATTLVVIALAGNKPDDADNLQFIASPAGCGIYNTQTKTLYLYKMWMNNMKGHPSQTFKVAADGSSLTEVK